ncbi:MAG: SlyX family protein [Gammaproteobacteria bacterium]|nr:SlyX family protein [Gammaproteobacteria bacterium]
MEDRIVELETKLAFQDDLLAQLDAVVQQQSMMIDKLQLRVERLEQQLQTALPSMIKSESEETPPPHY